VAVPGGTKARIFAASATPGAGGLRVHRNQAFIVPSADVANPHLP